MPSDEKRRKAIQNDQVKIFEVNEVDEFEKANPAIPETDFYNQY